MNYTKTLRAYCLQNKGKIFDTGKMAEDYFPMIPYKTLLRVMNRLEQEKVVVTVSKGVYFICDDAQDIDAAIFDYYVNNGHGIVAGESLCYQLGIIKEAPKNVIIYTNMISSGHKTVGKYQMTQANLYYGKSECDLIRLLELIETAPNINDMDTARFSELVEQGVDSYMDWIFKEIISHINYEFATIVTLTEALRNAGSEDVSCLDLYRSYRKNK